MLVLSLVKMMQTQTTSAKEMCRCRTTMMSTMWMTCLAGGRGFRPHEGLQTLRGVISTNTTRPPSLTTIVLIETGISPVAANMSSASMRLSASLCTTWLSALALSCPRKAASQALNAQPALGLDGTSKVAMKFGSIINTAAECCHQTSKGTSELCLCSRVGSSLLRQSMRSQPLLLVNAYYVRVCCFLFAFPDR